MNLAVMIIIIGVSVMLGCLMPSEMVWVKIFFISMLLFIILSIADLKTDLVHLQSTCNFTKTDNIEIKK